MEIQPLEVLKWIGIVLAAGFIGYFGRYLAMMIIDRMQRKKPGESTAGGSGSKPAGGEATSAEEARLKLEKKKAKAETKKIKKESKN